MSVHQECPQCLAQADPTHTFCGTCGSRLSTDAPHTTSALQQLPERELRRTVNSPPFPVRAPDTERGLRAVRRLTMTRLVLVCVIGSLLLMVFLGKNFYAHWLWTHGMVGLAAGIEVWFSLQRDSR